MRKLLFLFGLAFVLIMGVSFASSEVVTLSNSTVELTLANEVTTLEDNTFCSFYINENLYECSGCNCNKLLRQATRTEKKLKK